MKEHDPIIKFTSAFEDGVGLLTESAEEFRAEIDTIDDGSEIIRVIRCHLTTLGLVEDYHACKLIEELMLFDTRIDVEWLALIIREELRNMIDEYKKEQKRFEEKREKV